MRLFAFLVGIQKAHVSFAAAPEHIVLCAKLDACVNGVLDLYDGTCHYVEVGIGGGTVHVACISEHIGGGPQELDARSVHLLFQIIGDGCQVLFVFLYAFAFADEVYIVEAEVGNAEFLHDFESCIGLVLGTFQCRFSLIPGEGLGTTAELVAAFGTEGVPPCHGKAQPVLHRTAHDHLFCVIIVEGHGVLAVLAFKGNLADLGEIFFHSQNYMV